MSSLNNFDHISNDISHPLKTLNSVIPYRTIVKNAYQNTNFIISQPNHMLWVINENESTFYFDVSNWKKCIFLVKLGRN